MLLNDTSNWAIALNKFLGSRATPSAVSLSPDRADGLLFISGGRGLCFAMPSRPAQVEKKNTLKSLKKTQRFCFCNQCIGHHNAPAAIRTPSAR